MSMLEMLESAEFVVDNHGHKKAVLLDYDVWKKLLSLLEDWEDAAEIQRLRESEEEAIPWEDVKAQLRAEGLDV